jgi:hypothetical protein
MGLGRIRGSRADLLAFISRCVLFIAIFLSQSRLRSQSTHHNLLKEIYAYHDFAIETAVPVEVPGVIGIWYDARDDYETLVHFNLVMTDLNEKFTPYKAAETLGVPPQEEWNEIYAVVAKMHAQYWHDPKLKAPPFAADTSGVFKLAAIEEMMATSVGSLVEPWRTAINTHMTKNTEDAEASLAVMEMWKGDDCATLYHAAIKKLAEAPMTLCHGDINPGNIWKSKTVTSGDAKYCLADWQLVRMGPVAWDFTTMQIGLETKAPCSANLTETLKSYHAELIRLKPEIAAEYSLEQLTYHVKCASVAFWMFVLAFVYHTTVASTDSGAMDEGKAAFTWDVFMPNCFRRCGECFKELDILAFQRELLDHPELDGPGGK